MSLETRIEKLEGETATSEEVFPLPVGSDTVHLTKRQIRELLDQVSERDQGIKVNPRWAQGGYANGVS